MRMPPVFRASMRGLDVVHGVSDVVQALAALLDELSHGAGGVGGFEQFEAHFLAGGPPGTDREETDLDLLVGDGLDAFKAGAEDLLVEVLGGFDALDRDADVIDSFGLDHGSTLVNRGSIDDRRSGARLHVGGQRAGQSPAPSEPGSPLPRSRRPRREMRQADFAAAPQPGQGTARLASTGAGDCPARFNRGRGLPGSPRGSPHTVRCFHT